jgi:predicted nucleic acid-binding Zn finger protein
VSVDSAALGAYVSVFGLFAVLLFALWKSGERKNQIVRLMGESKRNWIATNGTILESEAKFSSFKAIPFTYVTIRYQYLVNNQFFISNVVNYLQLSSKEPMATLTGNKVELIKSKYDKNMEIVVYYNPRDPSQSVLMFELE